MSLQFTVADVARFRAMVSVTQSCWIWEGSRTRRGYGQFGLNGKCVSAHRFAWIINYGAIPNGLGVLHRCDVPPCVNPEHLFVGTQADNMRDMRAKGRQRSGTTGLFARHVGIKRGPNHYRTKLTAEDISVIKRRYSNGELQREIATDFGVQQSTISIVLRR